ncbi:MAG: hypothetical protein HY735_03845 [Verrucomicrobia bacterium]|nr:hypothetical protein [Verrucomicrobiota bacterium]
MPPLPALGGESIMQGKKFLRVVSFALEASLQPATNLDLPLRVIVFRSPTEVFCEFQAIFDRESVNSSL